MVSFQALVLSLPTRNSTIRMRVWRALKETGCGVLRDGVYVLPAGTAGGAVLEGMGAEIRSAGGFAMTAGLEPGTPEQAAEVVRLFDRGAEYGALLQKIGAARATLARLGARRGRTLLLRLARAFERLSRIDFFPGQAKLQCADALADLERSFQAAQAGAEPQPAEKRLRRLDRARYRGRLWATRKQPWVDRLASAWLIKRFIDREARFAWIERPADRPKKALGFDYDGAQFTHVGSRVTFEVLLASFGLDGDPALAAIGAAVHYLDVGGVAVADAKGLETLLTGAREKARDDDALLAEAMRVFDLFHTAYTRTSRSP